MTTPNKLILHSGGSLSVRINGRWREKIRKLTAAEYLALPYADRERIVHAEFERSKSLIVGHQPIVVRHKKTARSFQAPGG